MDTDTWKATYRCISFRSEGIRRSLQVPFVIVHATPNAQRERCSQKLAVKEATDNSANLFLIFNAYTGEYVKLYCLQKEAQTSSDESSLALEEDASYAPLGL